MTHVTEFKLAFDGFGLHVESCWASAKGQGDERYVLFLHGGGAATSSEGTRYLREDLAVRGVASVAMDFSGHGRSGGSMEEASLARRRKEALRVVGSLQPPQPRAIVATSMAGHIACRLTETLRPDALVLFCPAAYELRAEDALFGDAFRSVIRGTRSFEDSPAFEALRRFEGRLLCFYGSEDAVVPQAVQHGYARASAQSRRADFRWLDGAGHRLHDWISTRPLLRRQAVEQIVAAIG
ncbi:alpha/beta hydrolase [Pseudorhodoferax soli]|uniref:Serine aminopeptidase S33 domain-containing protein n=1 Tax=Pseudorhodoferax soli TaxID=545864 RepID=A0A368XAZ6_9BURK|nr:alpha/beta fold hydrolase [Pseudorhodoferax soli]RCW65143.1 hypothetical protein DES41_11367 [Pseudorhodoferax soli]